jgi:hypothetical protein
MTIRPILISAFILTAAVSGQASNYGPFSCAMCGNGFDASAFNVVTLGTGLLVYNVAASYFTSSSKGTVVVYNGNTVTANTTGGVPVLFNLPEVTSLSTSNGSINGSILAETHDQYYNGLLPSLVATPEPATFLLFGGALIAFGMIGRNGRTKGR